MAVAAAASTSAAATTAAARTQVSQAQATATASTTAHEGAVVEEATAGDALAQAETEAADMQAAQEAATAAEGESDAASAERAPRIGQDISLRKTLEEHPDALAAMGLTQYADRPEVGRAAAEAMATGDWKVLQRAGLSKDEAKAVFNTVEAVRIGVENTSYEANFAEGTVIDDKIGRDEIVIPGVKSFDELEQTREGDDLLLTTAEGTVRVVGFYDDRRGNIDRIRLADAESDDHADTTMYREEYIFDAELEDGTYREEHGIYGFTGPMDLAVGGDDAFGSGKASTLVDTIGTTPEEERRKARNAGMLAWGNSQLQDVQTLMFGASERDNKTLRKGHKKILNRHYDPKEHYGYGSGASAMAMADKALQDLSYFSSLDDAGKQRHIKNIAKKGQKSSLLGKVLGFVGMVASFFPGIGQIIGAVATGLSVVANGGSLLDGIKAGLGQYLAGGGTIGKFGGDALTQVAATAVTSDGDLGQIGLTVVGMGIDQLGYADQLDDLGVRVDGNGAGIQVGNSGITFGVNANLDFGVGLDIPGGLGLDVENAHLQWNEGGEVIFDFDHDGSNISIDDEGMVQVLYGIDQVAADGSQFTAGFQTAFGGGDIVLIANQADRSGQYGTLTSGTFALDDLTSTHSVRTEATWGDVFDEWGVSADTATAFLQQTLPVIELGEMVLPEFVLSQDPDLESVLVDDTPTPSFETPETAPLEDIPPETVASDTVMEEVVVVGTHDPGGLGFGGGHRTDIPGQTEAGPEVGPTPALPGLSDAARAEALAELSKAEAKLTELLAKASELPVDGTVTGAAGLVGAAHDLLGLIEDSRREIAETGQISAETAAKSAKAQLEVLDGLRDIVGIPESFVLKHTMRGASALAAGTALFADDATWVEKFDATIDLAQALVPPNTPAWFLIGALDVGSSVGGVLVDLASTTPAFDILYDTAEATSASLHQAGADTESYFSRLGAATADFIEEQTGMDVREEVEGGFNDLGADARGAFDSVAAIADDVVVIGGSFAAAAVGTVWALQDRVGGDD